MTGLRYKVKSNLASEKIIYVLVIISILNLASHFTQNVLGVGNTYWISYIAWIMLFVYQCFLKIRITKNDSIWFFIICIGTIIGGLVGIIQGYLGVSDLFNISIFLIAVFSTKFISIKSELSMNSIKILFRIIWVIAIISVVYMVIMQGERIVPAVVNRDEYAQWGLVSFFRQRNIYASFLFFAVVASFFLLLYEKRKIYLISVVVFFIAVVSTGSRAALFSTILFFVLYCFFRTKNKWLLVLSGVVIIGYIVVQFDILHIFQSKFGHNTSLGVDSGIIRIMMWNSGFKKIFDDVNFIVGYGIGSSSQFLKDSRFTVESFHNVFMEYFFEGGIIQLLLVFISIKDSLIYVFRSNNNTYKQVWSATIMAYVFLCLFESGSALYMSNYFSVIATIIVVFIPRYVFKTEKVN